MEAAARKIQAVQRGRAARKEVQALKASAAEVVAAVAAVGEMVGELTTGTGEEEGGGAGAEEAPVELTEEAARELDAAATKLQAIQRGRVARKEVAALKAKQAEAVEAGGALAAAEEEQLRAAEAVVEETGGATQEELSPEEEAELEAAALKIQAMQRGRLARKEVEARKADMASTAAGAGADAVEATEAETPTTE